MEKPNRALNRYKGSATKISAAKAVGEERATIEDSRRMNRISYDRWEKTIDRGYDFVFGGPVGLKPFPAPRPSIWSRLHTDDASQPKTSAGIRSLPIKTKDLSNVQPSEEPNLQSSTSLRSLTSTRSNNNSQPLSASSSIPRLSPVVSTSNSARLSTQPKNESSRVPPLNLNVCPVSPVSYEVPKNSLPGEPIAMVRTGGGLSSI